MSHLVTTIVFRFKATVLIALSMSILSPTAQAADSPTTSLEDALAAGRWHLQARLRHEQVDDGVRKDADALPLRTRFGWRSGDLAGFSMLAEVFDLRSLFGVDDFAPERPEFAVIADPPETTLNRGYLRYRGGHGLELTIGRQRIIHDDARHIGNVGWRQNEQTFDAVRARIEPLANLDLSYSYLHRVRGVTPAAKSRHASHLLRAAYRIDGLGELVGFGYLLDPAGSAAGRDTYGLRFSGRHESAAEGSPIPELHYAAAYAQQRVASFDLSYFMLQAGLKIAAATLTLTRETLGSDGGRAAFQTPLGTRHAFNGWADRFLTTPDDGLVDTQVELGFPLAGFAVTLGQHFYDADRGGRRFGREFNLAVSRSFGEHYRVGAKAAFYRADHLGSDTTKTWLWAEIDF